MASVVNWAGISDDDPVRVLAIERDPDPELGDTADGGVSLSVDQELLCSTSDVTADDVFVGGIALSPEGAVRVLVTTDIADAAFWVDGLPVSEDGALLVTSGDDPDHYVHGWPVNADGILLTDAFGPVSPKYRITEAGEFRTTDSGDNRVYR